MFNNSRIINVNISFTSVLFKYALLVPTTELIKGMTELLSQNFKIFFRRYYFLNVITIKLITSNYFYPPKPFGLNAHPSAS